MGVNNNNEKFVYYLINKPYGMLSQFTSDLGKQTLASLPFKFEKDVYPVGRLDENSEGLLILTNDKKLNNRLLNPKFNHSRTYLVQVEGKITQIALNRLEMGVEINLGKGKKHLTQPAFVEQFIPVGIQERVPPVSPGRDANSSWIKITLREGKNRQIRKMTAKVGFPTLRLIREQIELLSLESIETSQVKPISFSTLSEKLKL